VKTQVLNSKKVLFAGETSAVVLPGEDGELSIWDFHQPCICRLKYGRVQVTSKNETDGSVQRQEFLIKEGVVRVDLLGMSILIEEAEKKQP
jgi:F0F1-type ATP synthase epsilon subunit